MIAILRQLEALPPMSRSLFLAGIAVLVAALTGLRLTLPTMGLRGPLAGRLESIDFGIALTVIILTILVVFRVRDAGMSLRWGVLAFLWLAACEPAIAALLGAQASPGAYPGPVEHWPDLPVMLVALIVFLCAVDRPTGSRRALILAETIAWLATIARPFLVVAGLDRLPLVGEVVNLPNQWLTLLLAFEHMFSVVKGLFLDYEALGSFVLACAFVAALVASVLVRPASTIPQRLRVT